MKEGQIVGRLFVERKRKMEEIIIRSVKKTDFMLLWKFINKGVQETKFMWRYTPISKKEQKKWFVSMMKDMKKNRKIFLVAEMNGKIIGDSGLERHFAETAVHIGEVGVLVLKDYWGYGIGKKLMEKIIEVAKKETRFEILTLDVYSRNKIAKRLYEKLGFRYAGRIPRGAKHGKNYQDKIIMYRVL